MANVKGPIIKKQRQSQSQACVDKGGGLPELVSLIIKPFLAKKRKQGSDTNDPPMIRPLAFENAQRLKYGI